MINYVYKKQLKHFPKVAVSFFISINHVSVYQRLPLSGSLSQFLFLLFPILTIFVYVEGYPICISYDLEVSKILPL